MYKYRYYIYNIYFKLRKKYIYIIIFCIILTYFLKKFNVILIFLSNFIINFNNINLYLLNLIIINYNILFIKS
ncbi:hypothetical protein H8356DRAFT_1689271 [Neocallimastix lanati (nom. inval.)]|nr:hypothetical protein H8356DRAFT_1689271 [Neocallimastix sp. JGI-2020a]